VICTSNSGGFLYIIDKKLFFKKIFSIDKENLMKKLTNYMKDFEKLKDKRHN